MKKRQTNDGIIKKRRYNDLVKSDLFAEIESYSDKFIDKTSDLLQSYNRHWVKDPLHQWSRQWEYPYVIEAVLARHEKSKKLSVLDLGSGITFLPFYLYEKSGGDITVTCADYDESLTDQFNGVKEVLNSQAVFSIADMRDLPYKDDSFDIVYSVSVLEHTENYKQAVSEIARVLKPGGRLILTFDISIDSKDDIPVDRAVELMSFLDKSFKGHKFSTKSGLVKNLADEDTLTSSYVATLDKKLLPWKFPIINVLKPLMRMEGPGSMYKKLAVYCVDLEKK